MKKHYEGIQQIAREEMQIIVSQKTVKTALGEYLYPNYTGKFYCKDGNVFVGCDNSTKHAWVEEFETETEVITWLNED